VTAPYPHSVQAADLNGDGLRDLLTLHSSQISVMLTTLTLLRHISVSAAAQTVQEKDGSATISVNLNTTAAQTVTVQYATSNGTAMPGSDYTATSGTLIFSPGQTSKVVSLPILEDELLESDETFNVTLSAPTNAGLGSPSVHMVTIAANDSLTFSASAQTVQENVGTATVTVNLNTPSAQTVTVNFSGLERARTLRWRKV
jgi:hypothetical protein